MAWTYTPDFTLNRDRVRLYIGDTNSADPLMTDEEIAFLVTEAGSNVYLAAALAADALAAKFARQVDKSVGDYRLSAGDKSSHFTALATQLRRKAATRSVLPVAGGISRDRKRTVEEDSDRVQPAFTRRLQDTPGAGDNLRRTYNEELS